MLRIQEKEFSKTIVRPKDKRNMEIVNVYFPEITHATRHMVLLRDSRNKTVKLYIGSKLLKVKDSFLI